MLQFLVYVLPFLCFSILLIKWFFFTQLKQKNLPPSPPKFPILGNLHQLGFYPHRCLHSLAQTYGPLMMLQFGTVPALIVSTADAAREILKTHDLVFSDRPKLSVSEKLLYAGNDVSTAPYGEYWRQMRSICVLRLLSNKRVQSFRSVREEEVVILVKKIHKSSLLSLPIDLSEMFASITNDVACRVALGKKYGEGEEGRKFKELLRELMVLLGSFSIGDFIPWLSWVNYVSGFDAKVERVAKEFDKFLDGVVEEHESGIKKSNFHGSLPGRDDQKDIVDVLLELQKDNVAGFPIARDSIKALVLDMFAAGTDTTYTVLEWAMSELIRNPNVMKRAQDEVRNIASGNQKLTEGDLEKMQYLKAVIKETLRMYPPIPLLVPRRSTQDVKISGYDIAAGTMTFTNAWANGRDPAVWNQPEEFRPERFLNCSIDFKGHDFELIPFGAGRRGCPGMSFAMATNELVLANLVNKFDWSLPGGARVDDLDMTECPGITIHRKIPLIAVATPSS